MDVHSSGLPLLVLVTLFIAWSLKRLIVYLAEERAINQHVLVGAVAGYLLLGLTAGLMVTVLETVVPGSFLAAADKSLLRIPGTQAEGGLPWNLDFVSLNYYAFVCLSTLGFGDILPETPAAQMLTVGVHRGGAGVHVRGDGHPDQPPHGAGEPVSEGPPRGEHPIRGARRPRGGCASPP